MEQLNELQIKAAAPRDKEYWLADGDGLYLRVRPARKAWVYRYKRHGKEAKLSIGHYPVVTLAATRRKASIPARHGGWRKNAIALRASIPLNGPPVHGMRRRGRIANGPPAMPRR